MKTILVSTLTAISLVAASLSYATNEEKGQVTILVEGINQAQGQAIFVLMDSESSHWGNTPIYNKTIKPINNLSSSVSLELPAGEYSAVVYHDMNTNGKLDTNFFGKPKEPYGFSNNARNSFGIPSFEESRFVVGSGVTQLTIHVE